MKKQETLRFSDIFDSYRRKIVHSILKVALAKGKYGAVILINQILDLAMEQTGD